MPVSTRSNSIALKPVSKSEWNAVEALLFMKKAPTAAAAPKQKRPHRSSATYTPGTFAGMEE